MIEAAERTERWLNPDAPHRGGNTPSAIANTSGHSPQAVPNINNTGWSRRIRSRISAYPRVLACHLAQVANTNGFSPNFSAAPAPAPGQWGPDR